MKLEKACADANILGHLYRSGEQGLLRRFFDQVFVDEWILAEISRKQKDILPMIQRELSQGSFLVLIDRAELKLRQLDILYDVELKEMHYLFLPPDEGEKRVIALARSIGVKFMLTDDVKQDGPYWSIDRGIITQLEALAFWDLVYLSVLADAYHNYAAARHNFNIICEKGYVPPYRSTFGSCMKSAARRLKGKAWYMEWCQANGIKPDAAVYLLKTIKESEW